jgi:AraC family transcriptional regulator
MKQLALVLFTFTSALALAGSRYQIEVRELPAVNTAVVSATVKADTEVGPELGKILPAVYQHLVSIGAQPTGAPFARYFKYEPGNEIRFEAGLPTAAPIQPANGISPSTLPAGKALYLVHTGPYEDIGPAYEALHNHMKAFNLTAAGAPWESYIDDPTVVPAAQVRTEVFYPIQ